MSAWAIVARLMLDVIVWLVVPALFLLLYTRNPLIAETAALAHVRLVLVVFLSLVTVRVALAALLPPALAQAASAAVAAALFALMLLYYTLVLIGLDSWGRVITWDLIRTYALQASTLGDVMGISVEVVLALLLCFYLFLLTGAWLYLRRFDWAVPLASRASPRVVTAMVLGGLIACSIEIHGFLIGPPREEMEPVSLTLYPYEEVWDVERRARARARLDHLALLDRLEEDARTSYQPSASANRRNVVLIVVDALRPDRMSLYGYDRETTPNLDRLAREGLIRKHVEMRSSCTKTVCALSSIANSRYVHEVPSRPITLHETLRRHGYRVHLILGGDHTRYYGASLLYGTVDSFYDASMRPDMYMDDDRVVLERAAQLEAWGGTPVMLQFHLKSTHVMGKRYEDHARFKPAAGYQVAARFRDAHAAANYYDNGVVQSDAFAHELLETLRQKGYLNDTLVVVTGDHGEGLGEHGLYLHGHQVYEELLRVPLLLIAYGYTGPAFAEARSAGSLVDLAPTVLRELGMPIPKTWSGVALQDPVARAFTYFQEELIAGLVDHRDPANRWKYWVNRSTGAEYAFNLSADPGEKVNMIATVPEALLTQWRIEHLRLRRGQTGAAAQPQLPLRP